MFIIVYESNILCIKSNNKKVWAYIKKKKTLV